MLKLMLLLTVLLFSLSSYCQGFDSKTDYYILIAKDTSYPQRQLIKKYGPKAFLLTYECKCYAKNNFDPENNFDIVFYYDERHRSSQQIVTGPLPKIVTLDEFAEIANDAYKNLKEPNSNHLFLVEPVTKNSYVLYKGAIFHSKPTPE